MITLLLRHKACKREFVMITLITVIVYTLYISHYSYMVGISLHIVATVTIVTSAYKQILSGDGILYASSPEWIRASLLDAEMYCIMDIEGTVKSLCEHSH